MLRKSNIYLHVGCHFTSPKEWMNIEASPYFLIQKIPFIGKLIVRKVLNGNFSTNVKYGDIVKGLPYIENESCKGIYCSHVLEHLSLSEFRIAIKNLHNLLQKGGIIRIIVPDLEWAAKNYILRLEQEDHFASIDFCDSYTYFGEKEREKGLLGIFKNLLGTSKHRWMWDFLSLSHELEQIGFKNVRRCQFGDCKDNMFSLVEDKGRFIEDFKIGPTLCRAVAIECSK